MGGGDVTHGVGRGVANGLGVVLQCSRHGGSTAIPAGSATGRDPVPVWAVRVKGQLWGRGRVLHHPGTRVVYHGLTSRLEASCAPERGRGLVILHANTARFSVLVPELVMMQLHLFPLGSSRPMWRGSPMPEGTGPS